MARKEAAISQEKAEWKALMTFGNGVIYAREGERKIVTPGRGDFEYQVERSKPKDVIAEGER